MGVKELNLVCMSGQGSVQAGEILAKVFVDQGLYVSVNIYPGTRARSSPVINYVKIADAPGLASCANYQPSEIIVFQEELIKTAAMNSHELVAEAVGLLREGLLLVNTPKEPRGVNFPFDFQETIATVDATGIAQRHLRRDPPPVGLTLLGAYSRVTGTVELPVLQEKIKEAFPGSLGARNAAAAAEAYQQVQIAEGVKIEAGVREPERQRVFVEMLSEHYQFDRYDRLPGFREGSPFIWRDKVPLCEDTMCICKGMCLSEVMCPDATGFIVRQGLAHQGYRIDVDHCRGCGICVEVCVGNALTMVDEDETLKKRPNYEGITVEPFLRLKDRQASRIAEEGG
ncbi:MAG: 2-oxoacid:acceptor oxidoreductase family protein [Dehalococcoidia bacterium]